MNKYIHAGICAAIGTVKFVFLKLTKGKKFTYKGINLVSPRTEITVDRNGVLTLGKNLRIRSGAKIRVRKNATVSIGDNFSMSNNCMIVAWEDVRIGKDVQFGPGVLVYDQDHDYRANGGLAAEKYITSPVSIGDGTWIGANSIILRGTTIGNNCVVAAGTVLKGVYPDNVLIYESRETKTKMIARS